MATTERVYRDTKITVISCDITKLEVDAIVNPANSRLIMGGGVAGAIVRAGGDQIQKEALTKGIVSIGKAVATSAGRLHAKYVIHVPTMTRSAMSTNKENVKQATSAALECASQLGIKSVAFPGMGTGVGGLSLEEAAQTMVDEVKRHVDSGTPLKWIMLVGFIADLTRAFERALEKSLP